MRNPNRTACDVYNFGQHPTCQTPGNMPPKEAVQTQHYQRFWNDPNGPFDKKCIFDTQQSLGSININLSALLITNRWMKYRILNKTFLSDK